MSSNILALQLYKSRVFKAHLVTLQAFASCHALHVEQGMIQSRIDTLQVLSFSSTQEESSSRYGCKIWTTLVHSWLPYPHYFNWHAGVPIMWVGGAWAFVQLLSTQTVHNCMRVLLSYCIQSHAINVHTSRATQPQSGNVCVGYKQTRNANSSVH